MGNADDPTAGVLAARTGGEREVLEGFLDFHRAIAVRKVRDVTEQGARERRLPSATTLGGLLKHLAVVERNWFHRILDRQPLELPGAGADGSTDTSWELTDADTIESLIDAYERVCAESRRLAAKYPLDHVVPHEQVGEVSLRWIYVHMVEETARHVGHADVVRELVDGRTGALG